MYIHSKLIEADKTVCNLNIEDDYKDRELLVDELVVNENCDHLNIRSRILHTSGLCILDTRFSIFKQITDRFCVFGDHIQITFFFDGSSRIWEPSRESFYDLQIGILRRNYQQEIKWDIEMLPNREVSYVAIFMSKLFARQLLSQEKWALKDNFIAHLLSGNESVIEEETYFISLPIQKVLQELLNDGHKTAHKQYFLTLKLRELFFLIYTQKTISPGLTINIDSDIYKKLIKVKAFLIMHLDKPPTIKQLARMVALNELKLKQNFKAVYGTTIYAYVIKLRMEKAETMLLENYSVNEMSARLGYRSVSHFIETFKKHFGQTPKRALNQLSKLAPICFCFPYCLVV